MIDNREKRWVTNTLIPKLKKEGFHMQKHEDRHTKGIPDVSFGKATNNGWIEAKVHTKDWLQGEVLKLDHPVTPEQKNWISKRGKKGGRCWVAIKTRSQLFLIHSSLVRDIGKEPLEFFVARRQHLFFCWGLENKNLWPEFGLEILSR